MQYYLYLLSIPFLYFNYKILVSDIKYKKIPNKILLYLIILIPFFYIYLFSVNNDIHILFFFLKIFITIIVSFILYYYGIWSAGDAKYLLVLSMFIPNIGIIPFISNIALITIAYLLFYFFYFYIIKIGLNRFYRKSLIENILNDQKEKINVFFQNGTQGKLGRKTIFYKLFKALLFFLTVFVIIRLSRLYIIGDIKEYFGGGEENNSKIKEIITNYSTYILGGSVFLTFLLFYFFRRIYNFLFKFFIKYIIQKVLKIEITKKDLSFGFLLIVLFGLISFITYEYIKTGNDVLHKLYIIFTLYLGLYLFFKILIYSYKVTFQLAEQDYIKIDDLKEGDIVDKNFLIKSFGTQACLGAKSEIQKDDLLLHPDPAKYFENIDNPIDLETTNTLKKAYKEVNKYHNENKTPGFQDKKDIKILKTFAFAGYIFIGFLITFFIQDKIFKYFFNIGYNIIKNFYS